MKRRCFIHAYCVLALHMALSACGRSELELLAGEYAPANSNANLGFNGFADAAPGGHKCSGTWSFASPVTYAAGGVPFAIAAGDFNRDGYIDLALANYAYVGMLSVLFNDGNGTFGTPTTYAVGQSTCSVAVGDFNRDGYPDVVVTNIDDNTLSVLFNAGDGTFHAPVTLAPGTAPDSVAVGDFNHDGLPDLAVVNDYWPNNVEVFFDTGKGTFGAPATGSVTYWPSSVVAADFNRDGLPDLAYANVGQGTVGVLLNTGSGAFGTELAYPEAADADTGSIAVGDFNGDGYPDLVAANDFMPGNVVVMLNALNASFDTQVSYATGDPVAEPGEYGGEVAVGDFNGDGHSDIAVTNNYSTDVGVLLNTGNGTFVAQATYGAGHAGINIAAIAVGDFNGDGVDDIATANGWAYSVSVLLSACK